MEWAIFSGSLIALIAETLPEYTNATIVLVRRGLC